MPTETREAINWALNQSFVSIFGEKYITFNDEQQLVDSVRLYFNKEKISYSSFSFEDLITYYN